LVIEEKVDAENGAVEEKEEDIKYIF